MLHLGDGLQSSDITSVRIGSTARPYEAVVRRKTLAWAARWFRYGVMKEAPGCGTMPLCVLNQETGLNGPTNLWQENFHVSLPMKIR